MIWYFLTLGISTLVVVCVAIALYLRLRRHLLAASAHRDGNVGEVGQESEPRETEP